MDEKRASMEQWTSVSPDPVPVSTTEDGRGTAVTVFASPYDVPVALRSAFDQLGHRLRIELRYLTGAEPTVLRRHEGMDLRVGRRSGRIFALDAKIDPTEIEGVATKLMAVDGLLGNTNARAVTASLNSSLQKSLAMNEH